MNEEKIFEGVALICNTLRESEEYALYEKARNALGDEPEKAAQLNEFRSLKYRQQNGLGDGLYGSMEDLFQRKKKLGEDALSARFLESEEKLCNVIRKAVEAIMDVVELDIPVKTEGEENGIE